MVYKIVPSFFPASGHGCTRNSQKWTVASPKFPEFVGRTMFSAYAFPGFSNHYTHYCHCYK